MNSWQANGTLEVTGEFLRDVLEACPQGVVCTNATGMVIWANSRAGEMLGFLHEPIDHHLMDEFLEPGHLSAYHEVLDRQVKTKASSRTLDLKMAGLGGKFFDAEIGLRAMTHEGVLMVVHTIFPREPKRSSSHARQNGSIAGEKQFEMLMDRVQRHLPGPVGEMVVLSYQALRNFEKNGDREGMAKVQELERTAGDLTRLLTEMGLNEALVPNSGPLRMKVALDQVVSRVAVEVSDLLQSPPNRMEVGYLPVVEGDPEKFYLLFRHLIANAVAFRKKQCPLAITVDSFQGGSGVWHILVKDNGIGFDNKDSDRIFEPFVQLGPAGERLGSGLGLTVCQRIVTEMGGKISALAEKGEGTTVILTFPGQAEVKEGAGI
ncbi:putative Histidine kinase [Nitrospina gracilis 3/211]|uniref:histidine kinase n=1 Tax=Nitrospina gracilis (strain 3/211) TaxID=1266370 RepID=M1Z034_NITG3|nr:MULTISPECIES: ATP-binding protein [Nitrospina]MCF8723773.1 signal transduction histidine kinase [Nitrospina sp. Nb-3]CCQ90879.1 putative Histidine kinase [Nitrospina gracilis 3/211]